MLKKLKYFIINCLYFIIIIIQLHSQESKVIKINNKDFKIIYLKGEDFYFNKNFSIIDDKIIFFHKKRVFIISKDKLEREILINFPIFNVDENYHYCEVFYKKKFHIFDLKDKCFIGKILYKDIIFYKNKIFPLFTRGNIYKIDKNRLKSINIFKIKEKEVIEKEFYGINIDKNKIFYLEKDYLKLKERYFWKILNLDNLEIIEDREIKLPLTPILSNKNYLYCKNNRIYLIDLKSLEIVNSSNILGNIFFANLTPSKEFLFVLTRFQGLYILDPFRLEVVAHFKDIGKTGNAYSIGVLFFENYEIGIVSTPYKKKLFILNFKNFEIVKEINTYTPAAGGFIFRDKIYIIPIKLPYE